jgi:transcriptional regulator with XRE-family HTH domain
MQTDPAKKIEVRHLRVEERLSLKEIEKATGVSRGTLSVWLRGLPLTDKEKAQKRRLHLIGNQYATKDRGEESKHHKNIDASKLTREQKGRIAESAVLYRLALHGIETYGRVFDGEKSDWLAAIPPRVLRIQVRWASKGQHGLPFALLRCCDGRKSFRRLREDEFDFLVTYDLFTDTAYVFSSKELGKLKSAVTIRPDANEAFHKMRE